MDTKQKKDHPEEKDKDQQNWDEIEEEEEEQHQPQPEAKKEKVVEKRKAFEGGEAPKKIYNKTKNGDIVIESMDRYVEPVKQIKEARGDVSNMSDLR